MPALHAFLLALCLIHVLKANPAATPHTHHHHGKEREEDGAFSPRDHLHHDADGVHHSEFDHEVILGSVKTAEEFDSLSPEEARKRLHILLTKMDRNKDDQIDRKELHSWILRSFRMLTEEEADEKFEDTDADSDGLVSWQEHVNEAYGGDNDELPVHEDTEKMLQDDRALFRAADKNGDGYLSKSEFPAFSSPEEHLDMLPIILNQTLEDKDKNKDGFIDFQEFVGEKGRQHDKEWLLVEKEKFDNEFDKNHDGRLDTGEILSWVVPSNDEIAEEEVSHLFAAADDDHDDFLSFDEILEHHDVFVGSEATDYGDHLHKLHTFKDEL